ncbi:MAG: addiction module protein [Gemmatimonadaceae bacterium]
MINDSSVFDELTVDERIALIGQLWDSPDESEAAPLSAELVQNLDRREAEADADPMAGSAWDALRAELRGKLRR